MQGQVLGMNGTQVRWLILAAGAWLIQSYDIGLISVLLLPFRSLYHLTGSEVGLLTASATVGIVMGVVPSGYVSDRFGRKRVLIGALIWYSSVTFATGWVQGWVAVAILRLVAGLGLGAMFPLPYTLLSELSPARVRGLVVGILDAFLSVGYFLAPWAASFFSASHLTRQWPLLFFIGGIGIPYGVVLVLWLPESPRWLRTVGREAEAQAIMRQAGQELMKDVANPAPRSAHQSSMRSLLRPPYRRRTLMLWAAFPAILFLFYAIMTFMPTALRAEHLMPTVALRFSALIMLASIPGKLFEGFVVERLGRKRVIIGFSVVASLAALAFPYARSTQSLLAVGMVMAFFGIAVDPAIKVYAAEQYPTAIRGMGVGLAEGVARLMGGALAPYIMAVLLQSVGVRLSFAFVAVVAVFGALVVALWGVETRNRELEDWVRG